MSNPLAREGTRSTNDNEIAFLTLERVNSAHFDRQVRICSSKGLDKEEFRKLLGKVMDMKEKVPDELLHSAV